MTVNAAASKSILQKQSKRTLPRSSEMSSGAPAKMLTNEQLRMVTNNGKTFGYVTLHARIVTINYVWCDSLTSKEIPTPEIHYKVNLSQTIG